MKLTYLLFAVLMVGCGDDSASTGDGECGNGVLDEGEACDGVEISAGCDSLGANYSGTPGCTAECTLDASTCQCTPLTCEEAAVECGSTDDGCGGTLECGDTCASIEPWFTCGGNGTENTCGATCELPCPGGSTCSGVGVCSFTGDVDLGVTTHTVTFKFLLDGAVPPEPAGCVANTPIANVFAGNNDAAGGIASGQVRCGQSWTIGPFTIPEGDYGVAVTPTAVIPGVPALPTFVTAAVTADGEVIVDMPTAHVRGTVLLAGAPPTETNCSAGLQVGVVELRSSGNTVSAPMLCGTGFTFDAHVVPGSYDVVVRTSPRSNLPTQQVVLSQLQVTQSIDNLVLDAAPAMVSGTFTIDGAAPVASGTCSAGNEAARITIFKGTSAVSFVNFGCNGPFTYSVSLPADTYRVTARSLFNTGITAPSFQYSELPPLVVGGAPVTYDVNVPLVEFTGLITLEGQPPVETIPCTGNAATIGIDFTGVPVPCGSGFSFGPIKRAPGGYSATMFNTAQSNLESGVTSTFVVPPLGGVVTVDFKQTYELGIVINTVNGAAPNNGGCSGDAVRVNLRSLPAGSGFSSGFGIACNAGFQTTTSLPSGDYELELYGVGGSNVPLYVHPTPVSVQADGTLSLDIVTRAVTGQIKVDGAVPTETPSCTAGIDVARVDFYNARNPFPGISVTTIVKCGTSFEFGPIGLTPGVYRVNVRALGTGLSNLPATEFIAIPRFEVQ